MSPAYNSRQSLLETSLSSRESQHRQRQLVERAVAPGWSEAQVMVIDEDLGESPECMGQRSGFERLIGEVAVGRVGVILSLEVSRISRANRNGYHLLDLRAVTQTLIGDAEALYDPCVYNDRLLLGLKGTMREAELYVMKQRLVAAVRSKAERGEFRFSLPPGYYWDEAGRIQKSPDERIRTTIELIFARFEQFGTINTAFISLAEEGIENLPRLWHAPTTRMQDKKRLIRCLVEQGVVRVPDDEAPAPCRRWSTGSSSGC